MGLSKDGMHHIGKVVEVSGLSLRTIRHYDEVGLVPPSRQSRGRSRLFTDDDIERLRPLRWASTGTTSRAGSGVRPVQLSEAPVA